MKKTEVRMPGKKIGHSLGTAQSSGQTKHKRTTGNKVTGKGTNGYPKAHS